MQLALDIRLGIFNPFITALEWEEEGGSECGKWKVKEKSHATECMATQGMCTNFLLNWRTQSME